MMPPVPKVPDWNTDLLTRGVQREGQHRSRTAGEHFALDVSSTRAMPLLCHAPQCLLELAEPVFRSQRRSGGLSPGTWPPLTFGPYTKADIGHTVIGDDKTAADHVR
jgi:hypothetical protein